MPDQSRQEEEEASDEIKIAIAQTEQPGVNSK